MINANRNQKLLQIFPFNQMRNLMYEKQFKNGAILQKWHRNIALIVRVCFVSSYFQKVTPQKNHQISLLFMLILKTVNCIIKTMHYWPFKHLHLKLPLPHGHDEWNHKAPHLEVISASSSEFGIHECCSFSILCHTLSKKAIY